MHSCNSLMYLEAKKSKYLYLYLARSPMGQTIKFQVENSTNFILF